MKTRRDLLKLLPMVGLSAAAPIGSMVANAEPGGKGGSQTSRSGDLKLLPTASGVRAPLDRLQIESSTPGRLVVRDGDQQTYFESTIRESAEITIGGALGVHSATLLSSTSEVIASTIFSVDCRTFIEDDGGDFGQLLQDLYWTMATDGPVGAVRYQGEVSTYWASWLMDNTQTLKGMKYFWPEVQSNVDFYAHSQREDGMIWENFEPRTPPETDWDRRFQYGGFTRSAEKGSLELRRAPVENHVQAFFLEAVYFSWKASGDNAWMAGKLDAAMRAVHYSMTDPYRWSTKYELLKRGFTVDTWDFLCASEAALVGDDLMRIELHKTHFGIFFGDNTNFIAGLRRLAEMLLAADRGREAARYRALAGEFEDRLNNLAWNGEYFTHWIPEDSTLKLDLGVDLDRQVSLSNAYTLNRNASHTQAVAIIKSYQRIRGEMPRSSPGEFYAIYPPFETGFGAEDAKWEYMNGGVMSCVAGELARGAFDHGFEEYGVDILRRQKAVADRYDGIVPAILRGKAPEAPKRVLRSMDLRAIANADFGGGLPAAGVPVWTSEPGNDLAAMPTGAQVFREVPFEVIDPVLNGRRACLAISDLPGYKKTESLAIDAKLQSFYLLHTKGGDDLAGKLTIRYSDGSGHHEYLRAGINVNHWWAPTDSEFSVRYGPGSPERMQVAWRGGNRKFGNVGVYVTGFENPHAEKTVAALEFAALETSAKWMVLGVTISDTPVFLPPWNEVSAGMPNNWGAAAVVFALLEGLAGIKDTGVAFDRALIAPRWTAASVGNVKVAARYPASRGYVRYNYRTDDGGGRMTLDFAGSAQEFTLAVLLPKGRAPRATLLDARHIPAEVEVVEASSYVRVKVVGIGPHTLEIQLA